VTEAVEAENALAHDYMADNPEQRRHERSGATILLIEDDSTVAHLTAELLEGNGYQVLRAATGAAARELLAQAPPDLVILDLILPDVDGLVLCASLRAAAPDMPILVSSGTIRKRDAVLALKLGADDFVAKPFDVYELEARVGALLRNRARGHGLAGGGGQAGLPYSSLAS
jgi:two-component system OmpR family response regulator